LWVAPPIYAQEPENLNKELVLVRPYEPSVVDAQKISTLPDLKDTFRIAPTFHYSILSRRMDTHPDVTPITAAKLQPLPLSKLYHGYIKAGIGTNKNPLLNIAFNSLRGNEYAVGALLKYDGAFGDVILDNKHKVFAGYSDAGLQLFGQKFFRGSYLYGDMGISGLTAYNYGYNPAIRDTVMDKNDIRSRYTFADTRIGMRSSHFRSNELNYNAQAVYRYAGNKAERAEDLTLPTERKYNENAVSLNAQLDNNMFGGNVDLDYYRRNHTFDSLRNNFVIKLNPWFIMDNDSIRLEVGMRVAAYTEGNGNKNDVMQYKIYPKVEFQFTLLKDIFIPFLGIDGDLNTNTYRSLINENPFITPGLAVPIKNTKLNIYAGLKGSITSKLSYHLKVGFTTVNNEHFFVNDTAYSKAQNYFTVVTDDLNIFNFTGEIYYNPTETFELKLKAKYNKYETLTEKYAWHKAALETEFSAKYRYNKFLFSLDMFGVGKRYAKAFEPDVAYYTLKSVLDFNLGVEYRYLKSLSFFFKLNNFIGAQYYRWNYYPSQRISAMVGFTYSL
jgi:hypothetical protein